MRRIPTERRWTNQRVAHEVDRDRAWSIGRAIVALVIVAAPFAAYGFFKNESVGLSYRTKALKSELDGLVERERRLTIDRAQLEELAGLETWAANHGLEPPAPEQVVIVSPASGAVGRR